MLDWSMVICVFVTTNITDTEKIQAAVSVHALVLFSTNAEVPLLCKFIEQVY